MKKHITAAVFMAVLAGVLSTGCDEDNNGTTTTRTSQFTGAEGGCTNGGEKIEIIVDGEVDDA